MHPPIVLFDFDGIVITHKALEYTALYYLKKEWYDWQNVEGLRLIDFARFFEESDTDDGWQAIKAISKAYKHYIPNRFKRFLFFGKFGRRYRMFEKIYEQINPGLEDILANFKKYGIPMGIVTSSNRKRIKYFRKKFQLDDYFNVYITREDVQFKKPNPYPIILALKLIKDKFEFKGIDRNKVFFIGDLPSDIHCAKAAKINSIALLSGHGTERHLRKSNPTYIIQDIKQLLKLDIFKKFILE
jgi:HAD superfamily hydrolase (TIGR01549 family)